MVQQALPVSASDLCEDSNADVLSTGLVDEFCELLWGKRPRKEQQVTQNGCLRAGPRCSQFKFPAFYTISTHVTDYLPKVAATPPQLPCSLRVPLQTGELFQWGLTWRWSSPGAQGAGRL